MKFNLMVIAFSLLMTVCAAEERPNLVLFLADDCTFRDLGCYGGTHSFTPAIDQLATEGMRFTKCYQAAPMCSPTRHNLFNGMFPVRTGAYPNHTFVDPWVKSLPHYLSELGYRVALLGKRHIGPRENYPFEYLGDKAKGTDHIDLGLAEKFLAEVAESEQPFCLVVCSHQPHGPFTLGDRSLFDAKTIPLRSNMVDTPATREQFTAYLAEIHFMDGQVSTLRKQLEQHALKQNSLFVFLSEQGNSFPFSKWTCYEDGVRSAMIASWPSRIKPGSTTEALVEYNDILPTFIAAAGGEVPAQLDGVSLLPLFENPNQKGKEYAFSMQTTRGIINGSDYFGIRSVTDGQFRYIYNLSPEASFSNAVTVPRGDDRLWGSWLKQAKSKTEAAQLVQKYLTRPAEELYDLQADPDNMENLAEHQDYQKQKKRLREALLDWMSDCGDKGLETELLAFQRMKQYRNPNAPKIEAFQSPVHFEGERSQAAYVPGDAFTGYFEVPEDGYYTLSKVKQKALTTSVLIDGREVLLSDRKAKYGVVGLKKGWHRIEVLADSKSREKSGDLRWSGPNLLPTPLAGMTFWQLRP